MKPSEALSGRRPQVRAIVIAHRARNPRVFGSTARGEDDASSDLDILIDPTDATSLLDIGAIRHELTELLGVDVDVVTPKALPQNAYRAALRDAIAV